jgi:hypothetical protein
MGKVAGKRVTFGASARVGTIAASLAAAAALVLPSTALAATEIGSAQGTFQCVNALDFVQASTSSLSGLSYAVPPGGTTISSWSVLAGADTGPIALEVWQPTAPPTYTLEGISPTVTLTAGTLNTIALTSPLPVEAGDLIGLKLYGFDECALQTGDPNDIIASTFATPATVGVPIQLIPAGGFELNVAASVDVTINPPPPPPTTVPTTTDQCKHGGWQGLTDSAGTLFKNQGDCVSFVATGGTNLAG